MTSHDPEIGEFNTNLPIQIRRLPNGGWIAAQPAPEPSLIGQELGAWSNVKEMLDALSKHLT